MSSETDPQWERLLDFEPQTVMARGVLIFDRLYDLAHSLEKRGFKTFHAPGVLGDEQIGPLLAHRVLITKHASEFQEAAAIHEFSLIDVSESCRDHDILAETISRAWCELSLKRKRPFLLRLGPEGATALLPIE